MSASFILGRDQHYFEDDEDEAIFNNEAYTSLNGCEDNLENSFHDLKEKFYLKFKTNKLQKLNRQKDTSDSDSYGSEFTKADIQKIHQELNLIHNKLVVS